MLEKLLNFDPAARMTVEEALAHPYLQSYHDPTDEPSHPMRFDFAFEKVTAIEDMKEIIADEISSFKNKKQHANGNSNNKRVS